MKKNLLSIKGLFVTNLALSCLLSSTGALATDTPFYVGADIVGSKTGFKKDYGSNVFSKKITPGLGIFAGKMFNENWGMEIGIQASKNVKKDQRVNGGSTVSGDYIDPAYVGWGSYKTEIKQRHAYLGALAKRQIYDNYCVGLMLGFSMSKVQAKQNLVENNIIKLDDVDHFKKTKLIPIARVSIEHYFNDKLGIRTFASWKNTARFKMYSKERGEAAKTQIKLKDTYSVGVGVTYNIA